MRPYSPEDIAIIREHYPKGGVAAVQRHLDRSIWSLRWKAMQLGIQTTCRWNQKDMSWLMEPKSARGAYVLGLLWGDGTINGGKGSYTVSIRLVTPDFEDVRHLFDKWSIHRLAPPKDTTWKEALTASISHKVLHSFLVRFGYRTKSKGSPDRILRHIPANLRHFFFRGWFDADGHNNSLTNGHDTTCIAGSWSQDWTALQRLTRQLGINGRTAKQASTRGRGSVFELRSKQSVLRFMRFIYQGESMGLSRKRLNYERYLERTKSQIEHRFVVPKNVYRIPSGFSIRATISKANRNLGTFPTMEEALERHDRILWRTYRDELMLNVPHRFNPGIYEELGLSIKI